MTAYQGPTLRDALVGDTITVQGGMKSTWTETVTRVGRTNVYVQRYGREVGYRMSDGRDVGHGPQKAGVPDCAYTMAEWENLQLRTELVQRLRTLGVEPVTGHGRFDGYTTDTLAAVARLLESAS